MKNFPAWLTKPANSVWLGIALVFVLIEAAVWWLMGGFKQPISINVAYFSVGVGLAVVFTLGLQRRKQDQNKLPMLLPAEEDAVTQLRQRLDGMMQLNQLLIDAKNERELVERALEVMVKLSGAMGCSFMPFDEWGQPINTYAYGDFPPPVLRAWTQHLSSGPVRNRCKVCQVLKSKTGDSCPLLEAPFNESIRVYCFPLNRKEHLVGMLNLYTAIDHPLSADLYAFIAVLLRELELAVEMLRLRSQEMTTMRQIQMGNHQEDNGRLIIRRLMEGLCDVLEFPTGRVDFKSAPPQFEGLHLVYGEEGLGTSALLTQNIEAVMSGEIEVASQEVIVCTLEDGRMAVIAPCSLAEGAVIGTLVLVNATAVKVDQRERALIVTVATQAAVLVDNVRKQLDREYRAVIQERIRLAREIHDSLAQTLAYLKLTAAQMQTQLANGDLVRLQSSLNQSYQALSEAYLDTRQAIDNLRLTPLKNINAWVEQILDEFRSTSGLETSSQIAKDLPEISPEIQAQLIRIVQEALSNVRKHAQAKHVHVAMLGWKTDVIVEISDDGVGFLSEDVPDLSRHGLRGMRERAELIGADFQIISQPAQGTTIRLQLPLNLEETLA